MLPICPLIQRRVHAVPSTLLLFALVLLFFGVAPTPTTHAGGVLYVQPGGTGDGSSWMSAMDLAPALLAATAAGNNELWVATGTYTPTMQTDPTDARSATFTLKDGVAIYGGFAGLITETLATRDWVTNVVTLSGDLHDDDSGTVLMTSVLRSDNSYHVVTGATGATLDGVTISGGNANVPGSGICPGTSCGGGMTNNSSNPVLTNVIFSGNSAYVGGGMYNVMSNPLLTNVIFSGNTAGVSGAAGLGGGLSNNYQSNPALTNVIFSGNSATYGGGMDNNYQSNPVLTNVTFSGNSAYAGGGMFNNYQSNPQIRNSLLWGNYATTVGPAIHNNPSVFFSLPTISTSLVQGLLISGSWNSALGTDGGGNLDTDPQFVNPVAATSAPTTTGDYQLQWGSPAIDVGNNTVITTTTDLAGHPRMVRSRVDMGAYEANLPVVRITRAGPNPTNAATVSFTITFAKPVLSISDSDFTFTTTGGQRNTSLVSVTCPFTTTTWLITVTTTDLATGTLRLDLMPLGTFTNGEIYTIDRIAPTVLLSTSISEPTNVTPIPVTVTFSEDVTGFDQNDLAVGNATVGNFSVVSAAVYTFTLTPLADGVVTATLKANVATDAVGNGNRAATQLSRTYMNSVPRTRIYLAQINWSSASSQGPDLVVTEISTAGGQLTLIIANTGDTAVTLPFWVDLSIAPTRAPVQVNDTWNAVGPRGLSWGVTTPLVPGAHLALTVGDAFYRADYSVAGGPITAGTILYAHVDAVNTQTIYGGVLESHERLGLPYNNILGPVSAATTVRVPTITRTSAVFEAPVSVPLRR
ncbi:MAG: Ig-like domain-containing protein [Chloroflexales bacterium]